jgi:hypothetical protein
MKPVLLLHSFLVVGRLKWINSVQSLLTAKRFVGERRKLAGE